MFKQGESASVLWPTRQAGGMRRRSPGCEKGCLADACARLSIWNVCVASQCNGAQGGFWCLRECCACHGSQRAIIGCLCGMGHGMEAVWHIHTVACCVGTSRICFHLERARAGKHTTATSRLHRLIGISHVPHVHRIWVEHAIISIAITSWHGDDIIVIAIARATCVWVHM